MLVRSCQMPDGVLPLLSTNYTTGVDAHTYIERASIENNREAAASEERSSRDRLAPIQQRSGSCNFACCPASATRSL